MDTVFQEMGKAIFAFANLLMVIIFFKQYQIKDNWIDLYYGVSFGIIYYILGGLMIYVGKLIEKDSK